MGRCSVGKLNLSLESLKSRESRESNTNRRILKYKEGMMKRDEILDFRKIKTYPLNKRKSKVNKSELAGICSVNCNINEFILSIPNILIGKDFKNLIESIVKSYKNKKKIIIMMGAHIIKCGLSPVIIDLVKKGLISAIAFNGACLIHDFELAFAGKTSEDVADGVKDGSFGMAEETGSILNGWMVEAANKGLGIGQLAGKKINTEGFKYRDLSIASCCELAGIPLTVHIAIGCDIIHQHPNFDGSATGRATGIDFRRFCSVVSRLTGGVIINMGSCVVLPEVFLKAITVARNLGHGVDNFIAANFDMKPQYRALQNVLTRPLKGRESKGYNFIGHHEIMIPLLAAGLKAELSKRGK